MLWYGRLLKALLVIEFSTINRDAIFGEETTTFKGAGGPPRPATTAPSGAAPSSKALAPTSSEPAMGGAGKKRQSASSHAKIARLGEDQLAEILDLVDMHFGDGEYHSSRADIFKETIVKAEDDGRTFSLRYKSNPQRVRSRGHVVKATASSKESKKQEQSPADLRVLAEKRRVQKLNALLDCRMGLMPPKLKGFGVPLYYKIPGEEPPNPRELPIPLSDAYLFNELGADAYGQGMRPC